MKVSAEVDETVCQLAQQIVVVGQPDERGERSVLSYPQLRRKVKFNLWRSVHAIHSACEYPF